MTLTEIESLSTLTKELEAYLQKTRFAVIEQGSYPSVTSELFTSWKPWLVYLSFIFGLSEK